MNAEKHQIEKIKAFEHQEKLEKNALYAWAENLIESIRSGRLFTTRVVGIALATVLVAGIIYYTVRSGKSDTSRVWTEFDGATSEKALRDFAEQNKKSPASKAARLQAARILLGPEGLDRLATKDKEQRGKAIANIEEARKQMTELAGDFKDDLSLQALCWQSAGEAEL
ncbi:MAG TPA: hypothetical protein VGJ05_06840, partial [Fimbriiglobus sp.]